MFKLHSYYNSCYAHNNRREDRQTEQILSLNSSSILDDHNDPNDLPTIKEEEASVETSLTCCLVKSSFV